MIISARHTRLQPIPVFLAAIMSLSAAGAIASPLPKGATTLREEYGSWQVICAAKDQTTHCVMQQTQIDAKSQQRVLTIELGGVDNGVLSGGMVMPFGLDLQKGISIGFANGEPQQVFQFSTCLPAGCIVPVEFGKEDIAALRENATLEISATANSDKSPIKFPVSLEGFAAALDRLAN